MLMAADTGNDEVSLGRGVPRSRQRHCASVSLRSDPQIFSRGLSPLEERGPPKHYGLEEPWKGFVMDVNTIVVGYDGSHNARLAV